MLLRCRYAAAVATVGYWLGAPEKKGTDCPDVLRPLLTTMSRRVTVLLFIKTMLLYKKARKQAGQQAKW